LLFAEAEEQMRRRAAAAERRRGEQINFMEGALFAYFPSSSNTAYTRQETPAAFRRAGQVETQLLDSKIEPWS